MTPATEAQLAQLTDKQREVLALHEAGKNPTEIGKELGITSQAVHGHFRRLRERGLVQDTGATATKPAATKPAATKRAARQAPNGRQPFDPASAIVAVRLAANEQRRALDVREAEIDAEIDALKAEKKAVGAARNEVNKLVPPEDA